MTDLWYMTRKIKEEYEKLGLSMSLNKTKYICINNTSEDMELESGEKIKIWLIVDIGREKTEVRDGIWQGWRAIEGFNGIWWHKDINLERKCEINNTVIRSRNLERDKSTPWLETMEIDALRWSCRISKLEIVGNYITKQKETERRYLIWSCYKNEGQKTTKSHVEMEMPH